MTRHWSLPNLLSMCDTCLGELIVDIEAGRVDTALEKARKMQAAIARLKTHCGECDERIIDEI
jgi:hypothetical protein